jgi:uncharacterized protein YbjT (DUF2867 family)
MNIAITGSSGFVGGHLLRGLAANGHRIVSISRRSGVDIRTARSLAEALSDCDAVAHCAGINREIGAQTYRAIHVDGTQAVVDGARAAGVRKIVLMSFLRARPHCGSPYHESKWEAEEIVRASGLDYTIVKAGMTYGLGDHMLDHLSHSLHTLPLFATVGLSEQPIRPLAVADLIRVLRAALEDDRLSRQTVAAVGPEELRMSEAVRRVAKVLGRSVIVLPSPILLQYAFAQLFECTMTVPLVAKAQVRILSEGVDPTGACDPLPPDLVPRQRFTDDNIRAGLPKAGAFGLRDLRFCHRRS